MTIEIRACGTQKIFKQLELLHRVQNALRSGDMKETETINLLSVEREIDKRAWALFEIETGREKIRSLIMAPMKYKKKRSTKVLTEEEKLLVLEQYNSKINIPLIAKHFGITRHQVIYLAQKYGQNRRKQKA